MQNKESLYLLPSLPTTQAMHVTIFHACCYISCVTSQTTLLIKLAQAALCAPPEVAFAMPSWPLLLPTFGLFFILRLLLLTHFGETPKAENLS